MNGEWPVLLRVIGKEGTGGRCLSLADAEELVVHRRLPDRMRRLQVLSVAREPWSIENDFLTPTMKIKRSRTETAWAPLVDDGYRMPGPVLWA